MAAKYLRRQTWWVRFYDPRTGALMRGNPETQDAAKAELLRQRVELEAALLEPRFQAAGLPAGGSFTVQDEHLKGVAIPAPGQLRDYDQIAGEARLIPEHGVVLVVTDERGVESCFGFFRFPAEILGIHGELIASTGLKEAWAFRDFVNSADLRYREIVALFT